MSLPWLRLYTEIVDDEKLGLLAFEDRWHYIAILCLKGKGLLDSELDTELLARKVAFKLGLSTNELDNVAKRLIRMNLIEADTFQPIAWDARQMHSDKDLTNAQRQQRYREKHRAPVSNALHNASVTRIDTDTDTDKEVDKKNTSAIATPSGVCNSVWTDFLQLRKTKKAKLTQTALDGIQAEADKAGWTLENALRECCARGWVGFKAEWVATTAKQKPQTYTERMVSAVGELTGKNTIESEAANVFAISRS